MPKPTSKHEKRNTCTALSLFPASRLKDLTMTSMTTATGYRPPGPHSEGPDVARRPVAKRGITVIGFMLTQVGMVIAHASKQANKATLAQHRYPFLLHTSRDMTCD